MLQDNGDFFLKGKNLNDITSHVKRAQPNSSRSSLTQTSSTLMRSAWE